MRIAVTRAEPEASRTASRIDAQGGEAVLAPLLTIEPAAQLDRDLTRVQALLFTSANGVRAFGSPSRDVRVLTVGAATATAARELGYANVVSADGDSHALAALARAELKPTGGKVLHISGAHIAGDLAADLTAAGFAAERRVGYEARAAMALPDSLKRRLADEPPLLDLVLFHSARAAEIFLRLARPAASRLIAVCISETVAQTARATAWKRVVVAEKAREEALLSAAFAQTDRLA
jgi:uroporphyrinogen-III synthase